MRMERSLHPDSVAGVIGFDVVRYRGTHGGRIVPGGLVVLRIGDTLKKKLKPKPKPSARRLARATRKGLRCFSYSLRQTQTDGNFIPLLM
jgi:hypothetical protein